MNKEIKKENWTWTKLDVFSQKLALQVKDYEPETLLAITRGGLFVAGMLAYYLKIKTIETIGVEFYTEPGKTLREPKLLKEPSKKYIENKRVLLIDDLVDSCGTMSFVYPIIKKLKPKELRMAVLLKKINSPVNPYYYVDVSDKWIAFPYEKEL